ncbi:MAG: hypothetical protein R2856_24880 [Caldilineaceae bacterium]
MVANIIRPEYTPEAMQRLYNLTPFIVLGSALLGLVGMEKRLSGGRAQGGRGQITGRCSGNPIGVAVKTLRDNRRARGFFFFVFISIFAIFLQDNILRKSSVLRSSA